LTWLVMMLFSRKDREGMQREIGESGDTVMTIPCKPVSGFSAMRQHDRKSESNLFSSIPFSLVILTEYMGKT